MGFFILSYLQMNDFFHSMIKPKTSQIISMLRLMTAELNSRISNEKNSLIYVDKAIYRYINEKNKEALIQASDRYVVASRRISGLELIKKAVAQVQGSAEYLKNPPPPPELIDPLNTICWAGHFLNLSSVRHFSDRVLVYAYGRNTVSTFSNSNTLSQDVRDCFYNEDVSEDEARKLLYDYCYNHNMQNSAVDEIIGTKTSTIKLNYPTLGDFNQSIQTQPPNQNINQQQPQTPQFQTQPPNIYQQPPSFNPQPGQSPLSQNQTPQYPGSSPSIQQQPQQPPPFVPTSKPPQFTPTSQPPQFTPTSQPPPFLPTSKPPQYTPTSQPQDNDSVTNSNQHQNIQNTTTNFDYNKKPPLSSASSFSFYPGSSPIEQSYKFNDDLLPLVALQPFEKENWPYLQESIAIATSYDE